MLEKTAWTFTGQGFSFEDIQKISTPEFANDITECYEEIFECQLRPLNSLSKHDVQRNEISAAILLTSTLEFIEKIASPPIAVAGYSVGQYFALHAAGCISRKDLILLVFHRCKAMNEAAAIKKSSMAAILGLKYEDVVEIANHHSVDVSNDNAPGNVTIAGLADRIEKACESALELGAYKAQVLQTTGAWHCDLMKPAVVDLAHAISSVIWSPPKIPVIDNVTALEIDFKNIERQLLLHLTSKVRWRESVKFLIDLGATKFIEISHFELLTRMGFFISRKVQWVPAYLLGEE